MDCLALVRRICALHGVFFVRDVALSGCGNWSLVSRTIELALFKHTRAPSGVIACSDFFTTIFDSVLPRIAVLPTVFAKFP